MVLRYGEPDDLHAVSSCFNMFRDLEIWTYRFVLGAADSRMSHLFYRPEQFAPRKLWVPQASRGNSARQDTQVFLPESCRRSFQELACDCSNQCPNDPCLGLACPEECDVFRAYQEIVARQGSALFGFVERGNLFTLPQISTEGLERLRDQFPQSTNPKARLLTVSDPVSHPTARPTTTPEPRRLLSREEIRDGIAKLEPKYRQFLELAEPLLTQRELSDFLQLAPNEKDRFIREFWKRRS
jgi:hypothetical protein